MADDDHEEIRRRFLEGLESAKKASDATAARAVDYAKDARDGGRNR